MKISFIILRELMEANGYVLDSNGHNIYEETNARKVFIKYCQTNEVSVRERTDVQALIAGILLAGRVIGLGNAIDVMQQMQEKLGKIYSFGFISGDKVYSLSQERMFLAENIAVTAVLVDARIQVMQPLNMETFYQDLRKHVASAEMFEDCKLVVAQADKAQPHYSTLPEVGCNSAGGETRVRKKSGTFRL